MWLKSTDAKHGNVLDPGNPNYHTHKPSIWFSNKRLCCIVKYQIHHTLYKKRWNVEKYHRSLKQNASLAKSPTRTVTTQTNHLFASLLAYIKLERLKFVHKMNHFALKGKIYFNALKQHRKNLCV